jgi:hypothetical protein
MLKKLMLPIKRLLSHFATKLPVGLSEFESWADSIIELSGPYADRDSMVFAISSALIHADAKHGSLPKKYFVDRLRKAAANQVASQAFQDIKIRQQKAAEAQKAAEEQQQAKQVEATAASSEAALESVKSN